MSLPVWVSLPKNDIQLAEAAVRGGAALIKVHLNAFHRASGSRFGSFTDEKPFLEKLAQLSVRRGIMVGQETVPSAEEMEALAKMGFEAFNCYLPHAQPHLFGKGLRPILALGHGFTEADMKTICDSSEEAWVEASVVEPGLYGMPLTEVDTQAYRHIVKRTGRNVIVPTQKKVLPSEVARLRETGIHALLIGVIVMGDTPGSVEKHTREFVNAP